MKRLFGNLKKILAGSKPSPPEIKSRPHPTNIPNWMQQDSQHSVDDSQKVEPPPVYKHHNPNLRSLTLKMPLPTCKGNKYGTTPEDHPLKPLLNIHGLRSFYCSRTKLSVVKEQDVEWGPILSQVQSLLSNISKA